MQTVKLIISTDLLRLYEIAIAQSLLIAHTIVELDVWNGCVIPVNYLIELFKN